MTKLFPRSLVVQGEISVSFCDPLKMDLSRIGAFYLDEDRQFHQKSSSEPLVESYLHLPTIPEAGIDLMEGFEKYRYHHFNADEGLRNVRQFLKTQSCDANVLEDVDFVTRRGILTKMMVKKEVVFLARKEGRVIYVTNVPAKQNGGNKAAEFRARKFEALLFSGKIPVFVWVLPLPSLSSRIPGTSSKPRCHGEQCEGLFRCLQGDTGWTETGLQCGNRWG